MTGHGYVDSLQGDAGIHRSLLAATRASKHS